MKMEKGAEYQKLDLGSNPAITVPLEIVEVTVTAKGLVGDYATAFCREAARINPERAKQVMLDETELVEYAEYLLAKRIEIVQNKCPDYRHLKSLYIPGFLQYVLSLVGEVTDRSFGLKMVPVLDAPSKMTFQQALRISDKIGSFERDMSVFLDAMPRSSEGDMQVMSTALIDGFVRSFKRDIHPAVTYVTAFLGMKLRQEAAFRVLYRVQYDDVEFITAALLTNKRIFT